MTVFLFFEAKTVMTVFLLIEAKTVMTVSLFEANALFLQLILGFFGFTNSSICGKVSFDIRESGSSAAF